MVIRLRLVPGHMATHCSRPMTRAIFQVSSTEFLAAAAWRIAFSFHQATARIADAADEPGGDHRPHAEQLGLDPVSNRTPNTAAGRNPAMMAMTSRNPSASRPSTPRIICSTRFE